MAIVVVAEAENTAIYSFIHDLVNLNRDSTKSSLRKLNNRQIFHCR